MSGEKTEQPTQKKLDDARKKGQVAQSQDIHKLFITAVGFETVIAMRDVFTEKIESMFLLSLEKLNEPFLTTFAELSMSMLFIGFGISLLVVVAVVFARFVSSFVQYGFLMAPESLAPSLDKLSPVSGIKNIFSVKKLVELLSNIAKAIVLAVIFYFVIDASIRAILLSSTGSLPLAMEAGAQVFIFAARLSLVIFGILALLDFAVQKHFFIKQHMMSKDDIFREYKQQEGDPHVKAQRKAFGRELIESAPAPLKNMDDANAVVVNPTHFAVALRYEPDIDPLPVIRCKGVDDRAQDIIERARENNIPIIRYVWLARTLFSIGKEGRIIPKKTLKPLSTVYRAIFELLENEETQSWEEVINFEEGESPTSQA